MNNNHVYDMLVVGGGPGGYTAALYAARAGLDTIVLEKLSAGGQMALTEQIDNYPGFEDGIDGFSLAEKMQKQAERFGARSEYAEVLRMDLTAVPKLVETSEGIFRGENRGAGHRCGTQNAGRGQRVGTGGPRRGLLRRLRRDVLQGQNGGRGGRRQFRRGRCPPSQPRGEKSDPSPPQRHPAGHQDLSRAADTGRKRGIPLEQRRFRTAFRGQADRRPPAGHRHR